MDYNFVAQKNNFIDNYFIYKLQVTSAGVSTWASLDLFPMHDLQYVQHYFVQFAIWWYLFLGCQKEEHYIQESILEETNAWTNFSVCSESSEYVIFL